MTSRNNHGVTSLHVEAVSAGPVGEALLLDHGAAANSVEEMRHRHGRHCRRPFHPVIIMRQQALVSLAGPATSQNQEPSR